MVLENVKEVCSGFGGCADAQMWVEVPKGKNAKPVNKDRFIP